MLMPATFATATHSGLVRRSNEDSLFAHDPVFAVADGMGGAQAGEIASSMAAAEFEGFVPGTDSTEAELKRLIIHANKRIHELAVSDPSHAGMGTTLTAAVVQGADVILAHVGDSRAYLWRGGTLSQLTEDHSLVGEMVRSGQITEAEAEDHPQRSIITRALGVDSTIEVDTRKTAWEPGDIFLLCSDGLYSMIGDDAIAAVLSNDGDLGSRARELLEQANAAGGRDNITVVLFSPDGSIPGGMGSEPVQAAEASATVSAAPESEPSSKAGRIWRLRHWLGTTPGLIMMGVLLLAVGLTGAWLITRQVYYLGVQGDNLAIYQGLPYNLGPLSLATVYRSSQVKFSELEPFEQDRINRDELQSQSGAITMLNNYVSQVEERQQAADRKAAAAAGTATVKTTTQPAAPAASPAGGAQ